MSIANDPALLGLPWSEQPDCEPEPDLRGQVADALRMIGYRDIFDSDPNTRAVLFLAAKLLECK